MKTINYKTEFTTILKEISDKYTMVLATSAKNVVTARNITTILINDRIYFQTDSRMKKVKQIKNNPNVALCVENYQIQGKATLLGSWDENKKIMNAYRKIHESAYASYSKIKTQIVIEIEITEIKKWEFIDGVPYILLIDTIKKEAKRDKYEM